MKTSRSNSFRTAWLRCFVLGLHAIVAMVASGFMTQVVVWVIVMSITTILGGDGKFNGPIAEFILPLACFALVGLPLFGFLFSKSYSPTEPEVLRDHADR